MDWEAPCVSVHSPDVGLHAVLGHPARFRVWKLRTRTLRDQLHHQLVISRLIVSAAWYPADRRLCCFWDWILPSRWRMTSSLNDRIYIFLILTLCFGFPAISIVTSYLVILLTVRPTQWWIWEACVCIFCDYFVSVQWSADSSECHYLLRDPGDSQMNTYALICKPEPLTVWTMSYTCILSNGQQRATPLVSKRVLFVCEFIRNRLLFSLDFFWPQSTLC